MERTQIRAYAIGENAFLVLYLTNEGYVYCLESGTQSTDDFGPFQDAASALNDAVATFLASEWAEEGWQIDDEKLLSLAGLAQCASPEGVIVTLAFDDVYDVWRWTVNMMNIEEPLASGSAEEYREAAAEAQIALDRIML